MSHVKNFASIKEEEMEVLSNRLGDLEAERARVNAAMDALDLQLLAIENEIDLQAEEYTILKDYSFEDYAKDAAYDDWKANGKKDVM